jgi:hypothetical protein
VISRIILLSAVVGWSGINLLPATAEPVKPLTSAQLQAKAKQKSVSNLCQKKKKSKTVKELCQKWGEQA